MRATTLRFLLGGLLAAVVLAPAAARQDKGPPKKPPEPKPAEPGDYREFFKKPTTVPEFWNAIQFEIEVGRFDLAAAQIHALLEFKPTDAALVELADQVGIAAVLKLRNILKWSDDPKAN